MLLSRSVLSVGIGWFPPGRFAGRGCDPIACEDRLAVNADDFRNDPVDVARGDLLQRVRRRSVGEEREAMAAIERIDRSGETSRLPRKPRQHEISAALRHHLIEARAGVAGRLVTLEHHVGTERLETLDPAREPRRRIEERRASEPANKRNWKPL